MNSPHVSVLLNEVISYLKVHDGGIYCDFTIGYGGHASELLKRFQTGMLIGFDQDIQAIDWCTQKIKDKKLFLVNDNFVNFKHHLYQRGIKKIDGGLVDLGVSSLQFDTPERGFSYRTDGPFDMRMNQTKGLSAFQYIRKHSLNHLINVCREYGEIKNPVHVAKVIKTFIDANDEVRTSQIEALIKQNVPVRKLYENKHPARLYFQAIRIAVNDEINVLKKFLDEIIDFLNPQAIMAIITFHSLEEKVVKAWLKKYGTPPQLPGVPINNDALTKIASLTKKPLLPTPQEIAQNNRARSAKLFLVKCKF